MSPGFVIGLTGGIGTGKTTVARILADLGCAVISSDRIGHQLLEPGNEVYEKVKAEFGPGILRPGGRIDRAALGKIVFHHPGRRQRLNQLTHPEIIARVKAETRRLKAAGRDVVVEIPLLFEAGLAGKTEIGLDEIWVVAAAPEIQLARVMARGGLGVEEAKRRIEAQMPLAEKIARADVVIYNNGEEGELKEEVAKLLAARKRAHISRFEA
ncbi:MAG: dephospho-CoA kinase [Firmicutes bacterium]|nr:dephospho-CoA kinase [Bacillota bacterium]